jgi:hypothetical protein
MRISWKSPLSRSTSAVWDHRSAQPATGSHTSFGGSPSGKTLDILAKDVNHIRSIEVLNDALILGTSNGMGVENRSLAPASRYMGFTSAITRSLSLSELQPGELAPHPNRYVGRPPPDELQVPNGASVQAADLAMKRLGEDRKPPRQRGPELGGLQGFLPLPSSESTTCTRGLRDGC